MVTNINVIILTFGSCQFWCYDPRADLNTICIGSSYVNGRSVSFYTLHDTLAKMEISKL